MSPIRPITLSRYPSGTPVICSAIATLYEVGELDLAPTVAQFATVQIERQGRLSVVAEFATTILEFEFAESQYNTFHRERIQDSDNRESDFDAAVKKLPPPPKRSKGKRGISHEAKTLSEIQTQRH